jgi:sugar lactone lactonase YvrE
MWMDYCLIKYSPSGKPLNKITFPAKCITCPTWGGKYNDTIFLTSAQPLVEKAERGDEGGQMFRYTPGVQGMRKNEFGG